MHQLMCSFSEESSTNNNTINDNSNTLTNIILQTTENSNSSQIIENKEELTLLEFNLNDKINIATHNIRGINNILKMQTWIEHCAELNLHIISLTETKLKDTITKSLTNPLYKIFTSNFIPYKSN